MTGNYTLSTSDYWKLQHYYDAISEGMIPRYVVIQTTEMICNFLHLISNDIILYHRCGPESVIWCNTFLCEEFSQYFL